MALSSAHASLRPLASVESFSIGSLDGHIVSACRPKDLGAELTRLFDPAAAIRTLHWGRNYLYLAELRTADGPVAVVVKQFRNDGTRARWRRWARGGLIARASWEIARAMTAAGIGTPEPILVAEPRDPTQPSFYVARYLPAVHEMRGLLRALNAGEFERRFGWTTPGAVLEAAADAIRRLHDAGFWHRDLSVGNVLIQPPIGSHGALDVLFVDLNRARHTTPGFIRRSRDLCRLWIARPSDRLAFVNAYWRGREDALWWKIAAYSIIYRVFRAWQSLKPPMRRAVLRWRDWVIPHRPNPHIPAATGERSWRNRAVWDALSDQPYQRAGRWQKVAMRLADAPDHARKYLTVIAAAPRVWRRYRALQASLYQTPSVVAGAGVWVSAMPEEPDDLLEAIEALGARRLMMRVYPWDEPAQRAAADLAGELHRRGYDLAFGIPQNRAMVTDPARWTDAVAAIAETFTPFGRHFQIGQAINRSKWGVWTLHDYGSLFAPAAAALRRARKDVEVIGPAVIDFEFEQLTDSVNVPLAGVHFDIVSSLLYVDRRGAPENRQLGFDTTDKTVLLRAIADTAKRASPRAWITEMNWALWEGPYSPAGRRTSVDETSQADYLVRYFVLTLATGLVERVYWWQLAARGYGLIDATDQRLVRRRPSFDAFRTFVRHLEGATSLGPVASPPDTRLFRFRRAGEDVCVGWSTRGRVDGVALPGRVVRAIDRDGQPRPLPHTATVELVPSPRYFFLEME